MTRLINAPLLYRTWALIFLLLLFGAGLLSTGGRLATARALRAFADTHPPTAAYKGSASELAYADAARLLEEALALHPANQSLWRAQGWLAYAQDEVDVAIQSWSHVDSAPDELMWLADKELDAGNENVALEYYSLATQLAPGSAESWYRSGQALATTGKLKKAASAYARAAVMEPDNRSYWYRLGEANASLGDAASAIDAYTQALSAYSEDIGDSQTHYALGLVYASQPSPQQNELAFDHFSTALGVDDFGDRTWLKADALYQRGALFAADNKWRMAIEDYRAAIAVNPQHTRVRIALATALWRSEKRRQAVETLEEAIELQPDSVAARIRLAGYLDQLGEDQSAVAQYEAILQLEPQNKHAQERLVRLQKRSSTP